MERLTSRAEFLRVAGSGIKVVTHHCVVQLLPSTHSPRFGFTATKKLGGAVVRNRTKRRLRAAIEQLLQENTPMMLADYVLIGRHSTATCPYNELLRDLRYAFKKGRAWSNEQTSGNAKNTNNSAL